MVQILKNKKVKVIICLMIILIMLVLTMKQSYAAGDVSSVIQQAWKQMESQIKNIVNNVVFPVIDIILAVFFFAKLAMAYFDYRKQGQFDWTTPAILFACLTFSLIAPNYIWKVNGGSKYQLIQIYILGTKQQWIYCHISLNPLR